MGVDMFKSYHIELGILDTGMYDHDLVYGVSPGERKINNNNEKGTQPLIARGVAGLACRHIGSWWMLLGSR